MTKTNNYNFPPEKDLKAIREEFSNPNYENSSLVITKEASILDKTKYSFCQAISNYQKEKNIENEQLANLLGLDETSINKIRHYNIEYFALDSLISYTEKLCLPLQVKIISEKESKLC